MKKRTYKPKRVKFSSLLIRAFCVVTVLSLAFAYGCNTYLRHTIDQQAHEQISESTSLMQRYINDVQAKKDLRYHMQEISAHMAAYMYYDIMLDDPLIFGPHKKTVHISSELSPDCHITAALVDENDNIAASNRNVLLTFLKFPEEEKSASGWYVCDGEALELPEIDRLYSDYRELASSENIERSVTMQMTSAYIDRESKTFIPHKGTITLYSYKLDPYYNDNSPLMETEPSVVRVKEFSIDLDKEGYELIDVHAGMNSGYPQYVLFNFYGAKPEVFELFDDFVYTDHISSETYGDKDNVFYCRNEIIYLDGKPYCLEIRFAVNYNVPQVRKLFWKWTICFSVSLTVIALLWCWRKNVLNKTKYAFEDYQRDLTDHLAHDIKTPLMAISGYAENIRNGSLSEQEQQQYLSGILDNVAFTDSLISRTLFLNHIEEHKELKREKIQIENLVENVIRKYELLLDEKNITYRISGSSELNADRASLETIIENLVSNAVKYTTENGTVNVTLDKKRMSITNTVAKKLDIKELKRPFVRGDEARSNVKGNGLGLSIAERAAVINGYTLSISCTDMEFKAELKF